MLPYFRTVGNTASAEMTEKRSQFIGYASSVETEEDAQAYVDEIRSLHPTAAHNCYAYIVGERDQYQKQSDDGEPSGTAGKPILDVIKHQQLKNTVIVVTRYFGGVLLGAGGLVRAYSSSASLAIEAAQVVWRVLHQEVFVKIDYTWMGKVENELMNRHMKMGETQFTDAVTLVCLPLSEEVDSFIQWITNLTNGQAEITKGKMIYFDHEQFTPKN